MSSAVVPGLPRPAHHGPSGPPFSAVPAHTTVPHATTAVPPSSRLSPATAPNPFSAHGVRAAALRALLQPTVPSNHPTTPTSVASPGIPVGSSGSTPSGTGGSTAGACEIEPHGDFPAGPFASSADRSYSTPCPTPQHPPPSSPSPALCPARAASLPGPTPAPSQTPSPASCKVLSRLLELACTPPAGLNGIHADVTNPGATLGTRGSAHAPHVQIGTMRHAGGAPCAAGPCGGVGMGKQPVMLPHGQKEAGYHAQGAFLDAFEGEVGRLRRWVGHS